jgi:oxygen-independent coproporphyrinogen-3 oxidase
MQSLPIAAEPDITPDLLLKHNTACPRYTSYPTADRFTPEFKAADYEAALARSNAAGPDAPLALYVHLPFCDQMCTYCGCTVVVSKSEQKKTSYMDRVLTEVDRVAALLPDRKKVQEVHLGGGTPNVYPPEELARLIAHLEERFSVDDDTLLAIEVDPRQANAHQIHELYDVGFKRLSMGVQDFEPRVQQAVGRIQSEAQTREVIDAARAAGFLSVNVDLIYGLPFQTSTTFAGTINKTLEMNPDRVALFSFAYVPHARPNQRRIPETSLPDTETKMKLFLDARKMFIDAGYEAIGMDHFARPEDTLAVAQREGRLHRNFQGYTTLENADVIGFGMSAIGDVGGAYVANPRRLADYDEAIDEGGFATARGVTLTDDDEVRRFLIRELMCNFRVGDDQLARYGKTLQADFAESVERLKPLVDEGFAEVDEAEVRVTPLGRFFVRNVASAFDAHFHADDSGHVPYSKAV